MKILWKFFKSCIHPYKYYYAFIFLAPIYSGLYLILNSFFMKLLIDNMIATDGIVFSEIKNIILLFAFNQISVDVIWRISQFSECKSLPYVRKLIITKAFKSIQNYSYSFFQKNSSGLIISQIKSVVTNHDSIVNILKNNLLPSLSCYVLTVISLFFIKIELATLVLAWSILFIFFMSKFTKKLEKYSMKISKSRHFLFSFISDNISNMLAVIAFTAKERELNNLLNIIKNKIIPKEVGLYKYDIFVQTIASLLYWLMIFSVLALMLYYKASNKVTIGDFAFVFGTIFMAVESLWPLFSNWGNFVEIYGELRQSLDIVNIKNKINGNGKKVLKNVQGRIEFKDVHFAFNNKKSVLNDFNLIIRPYEKVGIIGNSGVGKSTLAHLLLGNFQVKKGEIKIDNIDTSSCTLNSLRKNISLIPQDVILFNRSVYENIKYGCFNATDKEIFEASNNAFAHKFISELDNGYDTIIGERGIKISTGQRQRIIIARALLKNAPIFIFDEATSALDNITEEYIKKSITDIMMKKKKTVIVIAHKLSSVKNLDRIIVMKNGKIIEDGEHKILVQINNGYYRKLYESQNNI